MSCLLAPAAFAQALAANTQFVLVDRTVNVEAAPIIVAKDAPPFTREAVAVLADYVEKISGSRPEIIAGEPQECPEHAIWVGLQPTIMKLFPNTNFDFEHHEEFLIKANNDHLVITGRDVWHPDHLVVKGKRETVNGVQREYGTANAVYTFIHDHLDVRWLWPGELGEDFQKRNRIALEPFELRYHPSLRARSKVLVFSVLLKHSAYGQSGVWARRQRIQLDSLDVHPGHSFKTWWDRFHQTHPEYFALQRDGTRSGYPSSTLAKLCVSNPDVVKQWLVDVEAQLEHNPNLTIFNTAPNDSYGTGHCVCGNCKAWDHPDADLRPFYWAGEFARGPAISDRDVRFGNECARMLKQRFPNEDYYVSLNAYGNARPAPLKTKPDDNVVVMNVANNFWKVDTPDKDCLVGKTYAMHYEDWSKLTSQQVWRPNTGNPAGWQSGLPDVPIERTMESFQFAIGRGCIGVSVDSILENWATQGPLYYVLGRMTWNPSLDWRVVLDDYYTRGFGPAAGEIKEYWKLLETARNRKVDDYPGESNGYLEVYNDTFFRRAYGLLDQAAKTAAQSPEGKYRQRVKFVRVGLDHTKLTTELREQSLKLLRSDRKDTDVADQTRAKWSEIEANCNKQPLAVYWPPLRPNERMARAGLFHPDFMDQVKSKTIAAWKRKATEEANAKTSTAETPKLQDARATGWHLVFQDDFNRKDLRDTWKIIDGKWSVADGTLMGSGTLISTKGIPSDNTACFQRLEFEALTTSPANSIVSDLSSFIHCEYKANIREPWKSGGYFFQFGGRNNTITQLSRDGESFRISSEAKIIPGHKHKIVIENDRGELRCFVDGNAVFVEREKTSLVGKSQNHIGFYFYTPAKIRRVRVYAKSLPGDLDLD
jgi:hypothetical protein